MTCLAFNGEDFSLVYQSDSSHVPEELATLGKQQWWRKSGKAEDVNLWYSPWTRPGTGTSIWRPGGRRGSPPTARTSPLTGTVFWGTPKKSLPYPLGVTLAFAGEALAGVLELDPSRYAGDNAGYIPFCYIVPERRGQNLGIQLIGQAVSVYRPMGRDRLRLRCAPYNDRAQRFYKKYGFTKIGDEENSRVPLEILEKYIGYEC